MKISAIVPCYNEEENLDAAYEAFTKALSPYEDYEIIFTDDGSTDRSLEIIKSFAAKDSRVKYIAFSRNFGNCAAFRIGYRYAVHDWCIQYDCDLQSPPEESYKLIEKAQEGYDVVFGIRRDRDDPLYRVWGTKIQQFIAGSLFGIEVPVGASVFRVMRTAVARDVINYPARAQYFIVTVPKVTHNYISVETDHHARRAGESKWTLYKMFQHSFDLFLGFSTMPLTVLWLLAGVAVVAAMIGGFIGSEGMAYTGAAIAVGNLFGLAIMGEYIKRPFSNNLPYKQVYVRESNIPACQADFTTRDLLQYGKPTPTLVASSGEGKR
ncbi:glycosyltransferase family 2 protein [Kiloniella laminariae]|uniref:glycosyltransferase family 2 protein n=1 Tax=Kiloniella laminariae TaxID=454162 RepID=UPI0003733B3D|nr:glycosyltransferase family 2 protein [Kiloniella laminariae]